MIVDCETEQANEFPVVVHLGKHTFRADVGPSAGGSDSAPGPHDFFDTALATCTATTAMWYARKYSIPLERVETHVERDATGERRGKYVLKMRIGLHGPMTDDQRAKIYDVVSRCPIHRLMTTTDVVIETAPLVTSAAAT
jgi:putative redox protein